MAGQQGGWLGAVFLLRGGRGVRRVAAAVLRLPEWCRCHAPAAQRCGHTGSCQLSDPALLPLHSCASLRGPPVPERRCRIHLSIPGAGDTPESWGRNFHFQVVEQEK